MIKADNMKENLSETRGSEKVLYLSIKLYVEELRRSCICIHKK
jgi:hypothetical protein